MTTRASLLQRLESLIARSRTTGRPVSRQEVERLYTDGCAEALFLDVELRRVERRLRAARLDAGIDTTAEADALEARLRELTAEAEELRTQFGHLRSAIDWLRIQQERARQSVPPASRGADPGDQARPRRSA